MANRPRGKLSKSSFGDDDILDSLFEDKKKPSTGRTARSGPLNRSSATDNIYSLLAEEAKTDDGDTENSDVSAADPNDILKDMKDMDDMDADLFALKKKPSSAPAQSKPFGNSVPKRELTASDNNDQHEGADEQGTNKGRKPHSAPSVSTRNHRKFSFSDLDDPLADVLDDLLPDETRLKSKAGVQQPKSKPETASPPSASPALKAKKTKAASDLFDDDQDDLMEALGFGSDKNDFKKKDSLLWPNKERKEPPQRARTRLDDILESRTSPRLLERPPTGERKDQVQYQEKQQQQEKIKEPPLDDELTFGSYQPTLGSTPEGRQSRKQSVRFSTEDISPPAQEKNPKTTTTAPPRQRTSADWLGLKADDENILIGNGNKEAKTSSESPRTPSSPLMERKSSLTGGQAASSAPANQSKREAPLIQKREEEDEEEEEDWLAGALGRKKALAASNNEGKKLKQEDPSGLGGEPEQEPFVSKQVTSQTPAVQEAAPAAVKETSNRSLGRPSSAAHRTEQDNIPLLNSLSPQSTSVNTDHSLIAQSYPQSTSTSASLHAKVHQGQTPHLTYHSDPPPLPPPPPLSPPSPLLPVPALSLSQSQSSTRSKAAAGLPGPSEAVDETRPQLKPLSPMSPPLSAFQQQNQQMQNTTSAVQQQVTFSADNLQQMLLQQQVIQSQLLGLGGVVDSGVLQSLKYKDIPAGDYQALQVRILQLEGQVKTLQLERDQSQMMLQSVQLQHKQEIELMENTHKARVKLLEESAVQRETRARQDNEDLMERLATVTRSAEQERSELQAQYQRKVAQAQQERDREVERLRDFQRKSITEMKKDHEDQIHRLKKLKAEEIDAVTSATSQTRSLTVVIEQMEQFSSRLGELSSRVESTHENTAHGLEQGARHRDEQLRIMQERLAQQQKTMAEERTYLKEIISRMDAQLNEQQRQLEKERWKITAEQAKAESTQRGLEEERRSISMQINMEREELERAKSALLEEQKSVMQHCADERRKLAAEWADFRTQEKQRHERAEREVGSLLEKREGSIISLAQEQADLKLRTADLKQKEMMLTQERETLERLREELDREKERISSTALRLQTRAQEVEAFSKLAAEKYEEGERALKEAKHVEAEHESRLRNIHLQTDRLRQQEKRILQERMQLNHLQETGRLRQDAHFTSTPPIIQPLLPDPVPTNPDLTSTLNIQPSPSFTNTQSMTLQASLVLWKYTAEKERQYLQDEQIFLESLKKKSYRSSSHTEQPLRAGQLR